MKKPYSIRIAILLNHLITSALITTTTLLSIVVEVIPFVRLTYRAFIIADRRDMVATTSRKYSLAFLLNIRERFICLLLVFYY